MALLDPKSVIKARQDKFKKMTPAQRKEHTRKAKRAAVLGDKRAKIIVRECVVLESYMPQWDDELAADINEGLKKLNLGN